MNETNFKPFPYLSSQRLRLRKVEPEDKQEIYSLRSNEQVNLHLDREPAHSIEDAQAFIEKISGVIERNQGLYWAICLKENPKLIGTICCFDFSSANESAEIGYELHPFYQGKGIMQEAITTVLQYGFQVLQLKTITAFPTADNASSIRLLERNGFRREDDGQKREGNLVRYVLKMTVDR